MPLRLRNKIRAQLFKMLATHAFPRQTIRRSSDTLFAIADNIVSSYALSMTTLEYYLAAEIYERINRSRLHDQKDDLIMAAVRYAELRVRSQQPAAAADPQIDADRTRAHNVFIDACNILARNMAKAGEDASWRETLGDERKTIGDLACYIYCFLGLAAR